MSDVIAPTPGVAKPDPVLVVEHVCRSFGGLLAVDVERLEVQRHTVTALIGPNGAGKTTLFNVLTGFDKPDRGSCSFDGQPIAGWPAYRIARRGMVRTFQLTKALARLTVMDNMLLGAPNQRGEHFAAALWPPSWRAQESENATRALGLLDTFGLLAMKDDLAGTLSGGQRKLLEMARALMVDPALVMLDEPMAGVNPALVQSLLDHVLALRDEGRTVVFVEHDMDVVMNISDWVVCMAEGRVIAEGPPAAIVSNTDVIDAYLGREHGERPRGAEALE
jgi:branched-chain amino acid transport system ATP-binding protein